MPGFSQIGPGEGYGLGLAVADGAWWVPLVNGSTGFVEMWTSPDAATWKQVGGEGFSGGFTTSRFVAVFDGEDLFTFFYPLGTSQSALQQFSISQGEWLGEIGVQNNDVQPMYIGLTSTGDIQVTYADETASPFRHWTQIYSLSGGWNTAIEYTADVSVGTGQLFLDTAAAVLDSSDILRVIFTRYNNPGYTYYYVEVTALALQNQQTLSTTLPGPPEPGPGNTLEFIGPHLIWSTWDTFSGSIHPTVWIADSGINPSFTELGNLDPLATSVEIPTRFATIVYDLATETIYLLFIRQGTVHKSVQQISSSDFFTTSVSTTLATNASPPTFGDWSPYPLIYQNVLVYLIGGGAVEGPDFSATFNVPLGPFPFPISVPPPGPIAFGPSIQTTVPIIMPNARATKLCGM